MSDKPIPDSLVCNTVARPGQMVYRADLGMLFMVQADVNSGYPVVNVWKVAQ